jgi:hypothetical protein
VNRYVIDLDRVDTSAYISSTSTISNGLTAPILSGQALPQYTDITYAYASNSGLTTGILATQFLPDSQFLVDGNILPDLNGSFRVLTTAPPGAVPAVGAVAWNAGAPNTLLFSFTVGQGSPPVLMGQSIKLAGFTPAEVNTPVYICTQCTTTLLTVYAPGVNVTVPTGFGGSTVTKFGLVKYVHNMGYDPGAAGGYTSATLTLMQNSFEYERKNCLYYSPDFNTQISAGETRVYDAANANGWGVVPYKDVKLPQAVGYTWGDLGTTSTQAGAPSIFQYSDAFGKGNSSSNVYKRTITYTKPWSSLLSSTQAMVIPQDSLNFQLTLNDTPLAIQKVNKAMWAPQDILVDKTYYFTIHPNPVFFT